MADIDPNTAPSVMPAEQPIAQTDGRPTTAMLNWFSAIRNYTKKMVVDLTTKITTVTDQVGDISAEVTVLQEAQADLEGAFASYQVTVTAQFGAVNAAISSESTARANGDNALATQITSLTATVSSNTAAISTEATARASGDSALATSISTVDAKANGATANGAVYLAAASTPSGATAAYGWYLTAGSSYAGLSAIALSGGGSAIGMTATQLRFTDSGTAQQVFGYSSGVFTFQVPVVIQSGTSGARQVITNENTKIYDASNTLRVAIGINI